MTENLDRAPPQTFQLPILVDESEPDKSSRMNIKDIVLESAMHIGYKELKNKQVEAICSLVEATMYLCPFQPDTGGLLISLFKIPAHS